MGYDYDVMGYLGEGPDASSFHLSLSLGGLRIVLGFGNDTNGD